MDIPDIDVVIIYGAQSSVNQLHQVVLYECDVHIHVCIMVCVYLLIISSVVVLKEVVGTPARARIFYSTRQKCKVNEAVNQLCIDKENCRRKKC